MKPYATVTRSSGRALSAGFTLIEMLVTLAVLAVVMVALGVILLGASHSKERTAQNIEATQTARTTLDYIAKDVRSAGYDADLDAATPQPAIAYVDSNQIILSEDQSPYPDNPAAPGSPQAYNPAAAPGPQPLLASQWTPPGKYGSGAELIRYTLDLNDDGVVDANDLMTPAGADARATRNPNDYVLVRQVYGDNTGGVPNNNGGVQERVALVLKPGNGVPPLFNVYMKGSGTPYDWANGPVPANQLQNIDRVSINVTASSTRPDAKGNYPVTTLQTQVNAERNTPNSGVTKYTISGTVFDDKNKDHVMNGSDVGIPGTTVQLGTSMVSYTNNSGFFQFRAPAGTYTLRHTPAAGFGSFLYPDTFVVHVTSGNLTYAFPDTARSGGTVSITCYNDLNSNGVRDVGELGLQDIPVTIASVPGHTDSYGAFSAFASTGGWSATATVPDSMTATSANPVTGSITNGGTASASIGMAQSSNGKFTGTVFKDLNKNGTMDGGEAGIPNVWVGITTDGGVTVQGYAYTDASGAFSITVPANDPPKTTPYSLYCVPPANYFPTASTSVGGLYVKANVTKSGYVFGMATYQVISVSANRVLSLVSTDLMEKDWNGNQTAKAHADADLVLGADANGADQISVWFNQYNSTPLFNSSPDYQRAAPQSVLSMAVDTLDANISPFSRPDLVTGTKLAAGGNFFVWYTQNSSGNEGYFPTTFSPGQGYKTSDNGDVQAVVTLDAIGGNKPDILVGTKSATANQGQIELWTNSNAATPTFARAETYSTYGALPTSIGEVTGMALADFDNDGLKDLVVVTRTGSYSGQVLFFKNMGKAAVGNHFVYQASALLTTRAGTSVAVTDVNGDGSQDVIVGTQDGTTTGSLIYYRNDGLWVFTKIKTVNAPGIVMSLAAADMGGGVSINDLVVGWRANTANFVGGISIYYLDVLGLPNSGVDPSGGSIVNMVPAIATGNFNYGTNPSGAPSPYLTDLAVGVKVTAATGSLVIFVR